MKLLQTSQVGKKLTRVSGAETEPQTQGTKISEKKKGYSRCELLVLTRLTEIVQEILH